MEFDVRDFMPFDTGKYLSMWFLSSGAIMTVFYFMELSERKEWIVLMVVGSALLVLWHVAFAQGWRIPGFW
jgi:hypothetical protein